MGMFDNLRKKAEKAVDQHGDKIAKGIDKAAATASKKTGGKYDDKIAKGTSAAKSGLDKLDGRKDDMPADIADDRTPSPSTTPNVPPAPQPPNAPPAPPAPPR